MKLIFAGTPEFAQTALAALHAAGHEIVLVLTQPDRPSGRGLKLQPSAVKQFALDHNLPLCQPRSLRLDGKFPEEALAARAMMEAAKAEVMVVAAYGLILPQWVLDLPQRGCLNIHGSLLPRWRGAAPIHRAIEAGDVETGITIMQMDAGLDTGDMLLTERLPITLQDTTGVLHDKLAAMGARLIVQALAHADTLVRVKQPETGVIYAKKIDKSEAAIDWNLPADVIVRRVLAFNPAPGATAVLGPAQGGESVKIWRASFAAFNAPPGTSCGEAIALPAGGIGVMALDRLVQIDELQRAGGKRLPAAAFTHGAHFYNALKKIP